MNLSRRRAPLRTLAVVALGILTALIAVGLVQALRFRHHLVLALDALSRAEEALAGDESGLLRILQDPRELESLAGTVSALDSELAELDSIARPVLPIVPALRWLPGIGADIQAVPHLLTMAEHTTDAAQALLRLLEPIASQLDGKDMGVGTLGPVLLTGIDPSSAELQQARAFLRQAADSRYRLSPEHLAPSTSKLLDRFDRYLPAFEHGLDILELLPSLFGANGPRTYLLLAQNSDELRATGGFISAIGRFRFENGQLTDIDFRDSYAVDNLQQAHPPAPAPLRRYMKAGMLVLRDANWWPDFPTSARAVTDLYRQDQGANVDGVIAADLTTLRLLVQALEPIDVPGYDQPVTADNLQAMLMSLWQAPKLTAPGQEATDWWSHRKDFAGDVLSAILTRITGHMSPTDLSDLARALRTALSERHLLIYVNEPRATSLLAALGWDGAIRPASGDYLMIVDSNLGFNKVNPNVEQAIDYDVSLGGPAASARLTLTYRHRTERPSPACIHEPRYGDSYSDLMVRCYWDYLRVYVPQGSELIELTGADSEPDVYREGDCTVIAVGFVLETGQSRQIQILYRPRLPEAQTEYSLFVQKQAGTEALPVRVSIRPPPATEVTEAHPTPLAQVGGVAIWQGVLRQDWDVHLSWR